MIVGITQLRRPKLRSKESYGTGSASIYPTARRFFVPWMIEYQSVVVNELDVIPNGERRLLEKRRSNSNECCSDSRVPYTAACPMTRTKVSAHQYNSEETFLRVLQYNFTHKLFSVWTKNLN